MGNNNRSLMARLGLDTSGFKKGSNEAKAELTELNSAMYRNRREQKELEAQIKELSKQQKLNKPATDEEKRQYEELTKKIDKATLELAGLKTEEIIRLCNKDLSIVETQYKYCKREKIGFLCFDDPYYPERLKIINNPPCMFYYRGELLHIDDYPCFAFVGTRKCSEDGFRFAYRTAYTASASCCGRHTPMHARNRA